MSYILDALKKSEQARGGRKSRRMFEELPESPPPHPRTSGVLRRWLYLIAFILFLNVSLFVFWAAPWRSSAPPPPAQHSRTTVPKPLAPVSRTTRPKPLASGNSAGGPTAPQASGNSAQRPAAQALRQSPPGTSKAQKSPSPGVAMSAAAPRRPTTPATAVRHPVVVDHRPTTQALKQSPPGASKARKSLSAGVAIPAAAPRRRRTDLELKAAALKALLEKQAAHSQKAARPPSRGHSFANAHSFAAPNPAGEPRVPSLGRLPYHIRETLPNMSVSMLDYSKKPANRFIIINGNKRHEGDEITPDLKLERITPDGAIFKYRGQRFYMSVLGY